MRHPAYFFGLQAASSCCATGTFWPSAAPARYFEPGRALLGLVLAERDRAQEVVRLGEGGVERLGLLERLGRLVVLARVERHVAHLELRLGVVGVGGGRLGRELVGLRRLAGAEVQRVEAVLRLGVVRLDLQRLQEGRFGGRVVLLLHLDDGQVVVELVEGRVLGGEVLVQRLRLVQLPFLGQRDGLVDAAAQLRHRLLPGRVRPTAAAGGGASRARRDQLDVGKVGRLAQVDAVLDRERLQAFLAGRDVVGARRQAHLGVLALLVRLGLVLARDPARVLEQDGRALDHLVLVVHDLAAGGSRLGGGFPAEEGQARQDRARHQEALHRFVLHSGGLPPPAKTSSVYFVVTGGCQGPGTEGDRRSPPP